MDSRVKIVKANKPGIALALKYLRAGKSVVYPTDTAYGLGVDAENAKAVQCLYKIKGRGYKKPTHVIVHNSSAVKKCTIVTPSGLRLMRKFWPGALTIVLDLKSKKSGLRMLSAGTGTIGVRMPDDEIALALAKKLGRPITTTSANPAGGPAPYTIQDSAKQFKNRARQPDLYLDGGKLPKTKPSTIVSLKYDKIEVLRRGPIKL